MRFLVRYVCKLPLDTRVPLRYLHTTCVFRSNKDKAFKHDLKNTACEYIDSERTSLIALSQKIWENPELAYQEFESSKLLVNFLQKHDFTVHTEYHLQTAFKATYGEDEGINVGVICEYDALPDIGHACGHNLIAQVGIGAAIGVKAALCKGDSNIGKVTVLGCPAEESGGGKIDLINAGAFEGIDVAMMCHPGFFNAPGTLILAMQEVRVRYSGKASHAAGLPWGGVNALDAAVLCYTSVSCMRQQLRPEWRVNGIITKGGVKASIIPEESELSFSLRAPSLGQLDELIAKIQICFESAAVATGCKNSKCSNQDHKVYLDWDPKPYENLLSNKVMEDLYASNVLGLGLKICDDAAVLSKPTGSTDMGNVSHVVPSIHPRFDIQPQDVAHSRPFRDASGTEFAFNASVLQSKALAMTAVDILCSDTLPDIRHTFTQDLADDKT